MIFFVSIKKNCRAFRITIIETKTQVLLQIVQKIMLI